MRALLTGLGVIIGVSSVIGLMSIVSGIQDSISRQFSSLGAQMISINRFEWGANDEDVEYEKRKPLTLLEYQTVRDLPSVDIASPTVYTTRDVSFRNIHLGSVVICGTDEVY